MLIETQFRGEELDGFAIALGRAMAADTAMQVIALSRHDPLRSALPPRRIDGWLATLFGILPTPPLADPVLEALRRYCVLSCHGHARCDAAWAALREAGWAGPERWMPA